jgi:superoxide dismutase, Fe-Mn family
MSRFQLPHFAGWAYEPVITTARMLREWIGGERKEQAHPDAKAALLRLERELKAIESAAHSGSSDLFTLSEWLALAIRSQRNCFRWLRSIPHEPAASVTDATNPIDADSLPESPAPIMPSTDEKDLHLDKRLGEPRVPIGKHKLPPLPYPYNALEPYIDEKTMRLHHDEHHRSYVEGLNKAEKMMELARQSGNFELIKHWEREAAFNGAGHYLHTLFWESMSPHGGGEPTGSLRRQIEQDFGSVDAFKNHFSAAAEKVEGGGWAILVWSPRAHRLEILQAEKHQNLSQQDTIPLLPLDVWEHAYYLQYPNRRKEYIAAWWNTVNWQHVKQRFKTARQVIWKPF